MTDSLSNIHWHRTASIAVGYPSLSEDLEADFVVVGGGLTGTRTAVGLAEGGARVALLEGKSIGYGASGRSGGQCNPIWRATPDELAQRLGDACATRLVETTLASADALFQDIVTYGVDCDAEQNGWAQVAHSRSARKGMERLAQAWNSAGSKIEMMDAGKTQTVTGSEDYAFGLFHPTGGHVHPLSLTRGFARKATEFGAQLFEASPVVSIKRVGSKWRVATKTGSVLARQVILTTNGYTDGIWPALKQTFYPMVSIMLATAPLSDNLQKSVLPGGVTISDSRRAIYFARYDRDKRLLFGCIGSSENPAVLGGIGRLQRGLHKVFPQLEDTPVETRWGGQIAVTPEMMPHLHEPESGILAGLGFSGRGIAMTSVMARTLVEKAFGASDESLPFPVSPIKPIPLHAVQQPFLRFAAPAMTLRDNLDGLMNS